MGGAFLHKKNLDLKKDSLTIGSPVDYKGERTLQVDGKSQVIQISLRENSDG